MNVEQARFNMIEQQIRPANVLDTDVLASLVVVKREKYFPAEQMALAFADTELPLPAGTKTLTPKLEARIAQELQLKKTDNVLVVGAGNGYLAALLAYHARHVTVQDSRAELLELSRKNLHDNGVQNALVQAVANLLQAPSNKFDVIVFQGAGSEIPAGFAEQLNPNGRLLAFKGLLPSFSVIRQTRLGDGQLKSESLFETVLDALPGTRVDAAFTF